MKKSIIFGRLFFAAALILSGILDFIEGDFVMARSALPSSATPGRLIAVYVSGFVLLITGLLMALKKKAALAAFFASITIFIWALTRNIPQALTDSVFGGLWTNAFKIMSISSGALAIASSYVGDDSRSIGEISLPGAWNKSMRNAGRFIIAMFLLVCGIQHFKFIDFVAGFIPDYIPAHYFWAYLTGSALIASGLGLLIKPTAPLAARLSAIMIFLWVILLHIPVSVMKPDTMQNWSGVSEALSISGILFVLSGTLRQKSTDHVVRKVDRVELEKMEVHESVN